MLQDQQVLPEVPKRQLLQRFFAAIQPTEIPSENETVLELNQFHLSPEVKSKIHSLSTKMECSPEESLEMSLREHFCLPRPQRWMRESWVQGGVVLEGE